MISPVKTDTLIFTILIVITITFIIITAIIIRFMGLQVFQHKGKIVESVLIHENTGQGKS